MNKKKIYFEQQLKWLEAEQFTLYELNQIAIDHLKNKRHWKALCQNSRTQGGMMGGGFAGLLCIVYSAAYLTDGIGFTGTLAIVIIAITALLALWGLGTAFTRYYAIVSSPFIEDNLIVLEQRQNALIKLEEAKQNELETKVSQVANQLNSYLDEANLNCNELYLVRGKLKLYCN